VLVAAARSACIRGDQMIQIVETWQSYATKADASPRWLQYGSGALTPDGMLMAGNGSSLCNGRLGRPLKRLRVGFWHTCLKRPPSVTNSSFLHLNYQGDTNAYNQIGLGMNPDGTVSVFYGKNFTELGGLTLGNGSRTFDVGQRHWIELDVLMSAGTDGAVELRIDGQPELAFSGIRTSVNAAALIDRVCIVGGAMVSSHLFGGLYAGDGAEGWIDRPSAALLSASALGLPDGSAIQGGALDVLLPSSAALPAPRQIPPGTYGGIVVAPDGSRLDVSMTIGFGQ